MSKWLDGADFLDAEHRIADAYAAGHAEGYAAGSVEAIDDEWREKLRGLAAWLCSYRSPQSRTLQVLVLTKLREMGVEP